MLMSSLRVSPERITDGDGDVRNHCIVGVEFTLDIKADLCGEVAAGCEGEHCEEPLEASQEPSRLLERLSIELPDRIHYLI